MKYKTSGISIHASKYGNTRNHNPQVPRSSRGFATTEFKGLAQASPFCFSALRQDCATRHPDIHRAGMIGQILRIQTRKPRQLKLPVPTSSTHARAPTGWHRLAKAKATSPLRLSQLAPVPGHPRPDSRTMHVRPAHDPAAEASRTQ